MENIVENGTLKQRIIELNAAGKLPDFTLAANRTLYRVQNKLYTTANPFNVPHQLKDLGRYNDPLFEMGVWFGAALPTGALAEILGRERTGKAFASRTYLNWEKDLASRYMCEVETLHELKLLDIRRLLTRLGLTADEICGASYGLTQHIVEVVSRLPGRPFAGIAYESRHNPDGSFCYALWKASGEPAPLSEGKIETFGNYICTGAIADSFEGFITLEEMLTELLGYEIT
ncbi:RES family NAD+ phosphorylase [Pseudomonas xanthosomatis]|uniref:RES family NAD+ phosphorylase n=1 Tax=Pseudomonas xanthosomatis TaxID=2842356 RepID=UPI003518D712